MAIKTIVNPEQILDSHPGITGKSENNVCITDYFSDGSHRYADCSEILDGTLAADGTHICSQGELFVYRECGRSACRRQVGMVIDADNRLIDAQPFVAPCTGKL